MNAILSDVVVNHFMSSNECIAFYKTTIKFVTKTNQHAFLAVSAQFFLYRRKEIRVERTRVLPEARRRMKHGIAVTQYRAGGERCAR